MLDVQKSWPAPLRAQLPAAAASLALRPALFEQLTQELTAPHVGQLLEHGDNTNRVTEQLLRGDGDAAPGAPGEAGRLPMQPVQGAPREPTAGLRFATHGA